MTIRLAYDAGPGVGLGHRRRMEALAAALAGRGHEPATGEIGDGPVEGDVVVVDSYRVRADGEDVKARRVAAVDDLARDLAVDLVVDPAPVEWGRGEGQPGQVLRGLRYALVDPDLVALTPAPVGDEVEVVLVSTGGADSAGTGAAVARAVHAARPEAEVRLVVGPWSSPEVPDGVKPVVAPAGLAGELAAADLVVTGAGVTLLEALALGRPTVAVLVAGNQRRYFDGLVAAGAVVGATSGDAAAAATRLAADAGERRRLSAAGPATIDGRGARRVADAVAALA